MYPPGIPPPDEELQPYGSPCRMTSERANKRQCGLAAQHEDHPLFTLLGHRERLVQRTAPMEEQPHHTGLDSSTGGLHALS